MRSFSQKLAGWQGDGRDTLRNRIRSPDDVIKVLSEFEKRADAEGKIRFDGKNITIDDMKEYLGRSRIHDVLKTVRVYTAE